jgi:competence protein ComEC
VLITAALVRWVPTVVKWVPGPSWLAGVFAVPLVAQLAAAPIVAVHFRSAIPGAVAANLLVPALLAPTLLTALLAAVTATACPAAAAILLDAMSLGAQLLWAFGAPGRGLELVLPRPPLAAIVVLVPAGWLALQAGDRARIGLLCWLGAIVATGGWWALRPAPPPNRVELLPVADGLAATISGHTSSVLVDGGRWRREATELLVNDGCRSLSAVVASHTDEDHLAGLDRVLRQLRVKRLILPEWMRSEPQAVILLRAARRRDVSVLPVARGSTLGMKDLRLEILWPPAGERSTAENERSLVARIRLPSGTALITSDVGRDTERRLCRSVALQSDVLIAPHHGSRYSTTSPLLDAADPQVVLIPAGPRNIHNHPHTEVLRRLDARAIPYRYPARDGRCGARRLNGEWVLYP